MVALVYASERWITYSTTTLIWDHYGLVVRQKGICKDRIRLQTAFAEATMEFTAALNAQLLAVMNESMPEMKQIEDRIVTTRTRRAEALAAVMAHTKEHGC